MSVYIKAYFSSVWEKKKKRISWQKQIGKNEKPSTNSLCEERTARPVVCPDLRLQSPHSRLAVDTFQQQLIVVWEGEAKGREHRGQDYSQCKANILWCCVSGQSNTIASTLHQSCSGSNSNVLWYRKVQQKGRRTEKSRSSPQARQTYCSVVWAKQHNSIHTAPDSLAVDTLQQQRIVCGMRRCSQEAGGQVNNHQRSQDHDHGKANILSCCVSGQNNTTASALH